MPIRVVVPTVATAVIASATAITINLATSAPRSPWLWGGVAVITILSAAVSLWLWQRTSSAEAQPGKPAEPSPPGGTVKITDSTFNGPTTIQGSGEQKIQFGP